MCYTVHCIATVCAHRQQKTTYHCSKRSKLRRSLRLSCSAKNQTVCVELIPGWCKDCASFLGKRCGVKYVYPDLRRPDLVSRFWRFKPESDYTKPIAATAFSLSVLTDAFAARHDEVLFRRGVDEDPNCGNEESNLLSAIVDIKPSVIKMDRSVLHVANTEYSTNPHVGEILRRARTQTTEWAISHGNEVVAEVPVWEEHKFFQPPDVILDVPGHDIHNPTPGARSASAGNGSMDSEWKPLPDTPDRVADVAGTRGGTTRPQRASMGSIVEPTAVESPLPLLDPSDDESERDAGRQRKGKGLPKEDVRG